jgi:twinkle protein
VEDTQCREISSIVTEIHKDFKELADRRISRASAEKYQIWRDKDGTTYFPYYAGDGRNHLSNKVRKVDKEFFVEGDLKHSGLFGQQLFPAGSAKFVTLVEGEYDAPAAYELMGSRWPVVSVRTGADGATRDVADNFEYLNSFPNIVICFDKDEAKVNERTGQIRYPGQEAAIAVAGMFPIGKVKILTLAKAKDPNDYLKGGLREEFNREWWQAPGFTPAVSNLAAKCGRRSVHLRTMRQYRIHGLDLMIRLMGSGCQNSSLLLPRRVWARLLFSRRLSTYPTSQPRCGYWTPSSGGTK